VPVHSDPATTLAIRTQYSTRGNMLIGHFGTYGGLITPLLAPTLRLVLERSQNVEVLLLGADSDRFAARLREEWPGVSPRLRGAGALRAKELSLHLSACDLMVQPYPGGAGTRRGSLMAVLAHGLPVVATKGRLTEPFWERSGALVLVDENPPSVADAVLQLLVSPEHRARLGATAQRLYAERFDVRYTIAQLRESGAVVS
jgi:glycosyltransferase involved in cell wall biosynthesis